MRVRCGACVGVPALVLLLWWSLVFLRSVVALALVASRTILLTSAKLGAHPHTHPRTHAPTHPHTHIHTYTRNNF